ncbi:MAG: hypothetical protein IJS61_07415 [Firmicutes bacterium]|nr:hypothetical protein [Bacillota bacterium]
MFLTEYDEERTMAEMRSDRGHERAINGAKLGKLTLNEIAETMKLLLSEVVALERQVKQNV